MSADAIARGLATQARASAEATAALPRDRFDGSIVALGDSITANTLAYGLTATTTDSWLPRGIFSMLVARAGGRLRPVRIAGWPYQAGVAAGQVSAILVARGGAGYSNQATLSFGPAGGTGLAATPIVAGGAIVGATLASPGHSYVEAPLITVNDPGGGSGAVLTAVLAGTGAYAVGALDTQQMEAFVPLILNGGAPVARNVLFLGGTNNQIHGISLDDSKASILSICRRLTAGGVRVIAVAPIDRADKAGQSTRHYVTELRRWYTDQLAALVPGVAVCDPSPFVSDPDLDGAADGSTGLPADYTSDGLHPSSRGADAIARAVWEQVAPLFPGGGHLTSTSQRNDRYDPVAQPGGNLLAQALMRTGSSGGGDAPVAVTAAEAPWSGTRPPNVFLTRLAGGTGSGTVSVTQEVRDDGRFGTRLVLVVDVSGAAQGETYRLAWSADGTRSTLGVQGANSLQPGDAVRAAIDDVRLSGVTGLRGMKLKLVQSQATTISPSAEPIASPVLGTAAWGDWEDDHYPAWEGDSLFLQTRELTLASNAFGLTLYLDFVVDAGEARFTARLFGASLRKV
jgi:lysophospholipase L1-like esterase